MPLLKELQQVQDFQFQGISLKVLYFVHDIVILAKTEIDIEHAQSCMLEYGNASGISVNKGEKKRNF